MENRKGEKLFYYIARYLSPTEKANFEALILAWRNNGTDAKKNLLTYIKTKLTATELITVVFDYLIDLEPDR